MYNKRLNDTFDAQSHPPNIDFASPQAKQNIKPLK
jgi:hypothetical protein